MLAAVDAATSLETLETLPGWRVHALKGDLKGFVSLRVTGNWRLIFRFIGDDAHDVDFVDYH